MMGIPTSRGAMLGAILLMMGLVGCGGGPAGSTAPEATGGAHPVALQAESFEAEVLKSPIPVVVDFWAPWCGPCRRIAPSLQKLTAEFDGKINVCKLNVDDESELAERYGIRAIPALLAFKDGQVVDQRVGAAGEGEYRAWFQSLL